MNSFPEIKFFLNSRCVELDVIYTQYFVNEPSKDGLFEKRNRLYKQYPPLKEIEGKLFSEQQKILFPYFESLHKKYHKELNENMHIAQDKWVTVEEKYFSYCSKLFPNTEWPDGNYISYMSVIDIGTIIKKEKSFQLFYKNVEKGISNSILAHEILHFIFYEHMKRYPEIEGKKLWEMAEVFNKLVQNLEGVKEFTYPKDKLLFASMENRLKMLREKFTQNNIEIDNFVDFYKTLV